MSDQNIDTANFTQKDLMQHLLNVAQHAATREDLAEMRKESDDKFNKLDSKIDTVAEKLDAKIDTVAEKLDAKIDTVAENLDAKIDTVAKKLDAKIDTVAENLDAKIRKEIGDVRKEIGDVRKDISASTWKLLAGIPTIIGLLYFIIAITKV